MSKTPLSLEEEFEEIIQEAISKAEQVDCSMEDFEEGLKGMEMSIRTRIECEG
jgi:hypothetical protein